ncbi:MAG: (d)CMP kinase [Elusimicrobiota bacterium]|nr:(d)CMP kinase [Elusimicrobiota bacterium]MDH5662166.1 (d)CMP kinase [Elusimicrobiota bacterium]
MKRRAVIAIDGPAGAGKTTIARIVSKKLGYNYIDTGGMYRAISWKAFRKKIDLESKEELIRMVRNSKIELKSRAGTVRVHLDGKDVTNKIRSKRVTEGASILAKIPEAREELVKIQRRLGSSGGIVVEGRDIGTVVFPGADYKFYLDASIKERALRRYRELKAKGEKGDLAELEKAIRSRDRRDRTRGVAPLKIAPDAVVIDSTDMSKKEVVEFILKKIQER